MGSKGRPYRSFRFEDWEIRVGKGDAENDRLTFELSKPHDLWLHVAGGTPGSHVVLCNPERQKVPDAVLERAAELAAWYSKARARAKVEVHVCRVADVHKQRGAPLGQVRLAKFDRLKVVPTPPEAAGADGSSDEA
jgi:predicted ribosome quality control (RQC) complex YloA/Tae2 family protein